MGVDEVTRLPDARELRYVTPSGAQALARCQLQAAYGSDPDFRREVPSSPAARLGTAAHQVLEAAGGGALPCAGEPGSSEAFEAAWSEAVGREYAASASSPLEASWPSPEHWPDYARRKVRTRRLAERLARDAHARSSGAPEPGLQGREAREKAQEALGGRLKGRADVVKRGAETVIEDYKTGTVLDAAGVVKPAYRTQMLLYAVLEHADSGRWPSRACLIPLAGEPEIVAIDPAEAQAAADAALAAMASYNARIKAGEPTRSLAAPSPDNCRWCPFSVRCPAFWEAADPTWRDTAISAAAGEVAASKASRFDTFDLTVTVQAGSVPTGAATLRGLDTSQFGNAVGATEGSSFAATGLRSREAPVLRSTSYTRLVVDRPAG